MTEYPSSCKRRITPSQLEASAQAPCTRTTVGFGASACVVVESAEAPAVRSRLNPIAPAPAASPSERTMKCCKKVLVVTLILRCVVSTSSLEELEQRLVDFVRM